MTKAKVMVLSGYGLNCEEETLHAFNVNEIEGNIRHINDLIENPKELDNFQILAVPGGFSYGDDTGSGNAFAQKMKLSLWDHLKKFVARDTLTIGICNGCQIVTNLGLTPPANQNLGERLVAVTYNMSARYQCRWIDLKVAQNNSPWLTGVDTLHIPVAHGEGRFMMEQSVLESLRTNHQIAFQFAKGHELAQGEFPYNPNGSIADIAGITDVTGRILALMPHPERGMYTWQRDDFHELKDAAQREGKDLPEISDGMKIFANAAKYFKD
jgi:phosphoribosylformylglycinamidine synthase subunit PurQ / glutaminase